MDQRLFDAFVPASLPIGRFRPLERILFFDDFDHGQSGWTELIGNYEDSLDTMLPEWRDCRPPMISQAAMWDSGSAGSVDGTYSLKLATRAQKGHIACAIKRLTFIEPTPIQLETFFTVKGEASGTGPGFADVRGFGVLFDLQNQAGRAMPHLRYHNGEEGELYHRWQYRTSVNARTCVGSSGDVASTYHLSPAGWLDIPGDDQPLCDNEIATKQNWHYLRVRLDLRTLSLDEFQCNDRRFDMRNLREIRLPAEPTLSQMLNVTFFVEAAAERRAFLYLDSVLLSAGNETQARGSTRYNELAKFSRRSVK
jgi:hypothetical protein